MRTRNRLVGGALVALLGLFAAACGDDGDSSTDPVTTTTAGTPGTTTAPDAAPTTTEAPSGSITLYNGRAEALVQEIIDEFVADTGIQVDVRSAGSGALGAQLLTEGSASPADVFFSQDAGALGAVTKAGLFDELPASILSKVDPGYSATDGTWVGLSGRVRVVVYNPELAPNPPQSLQDVIDPEWRGKVAYAPTNASWQAFVTALRVSLGESEARTWLEAFKANEPVEFSGNGAIRDAVDAGEVPVGLINHYYLYEKISREGDAVVAQNQYLTDGDIGGLVNVTGAGVLSSSSNKPAALALVEYLLSDKAQTYFAERTFEYPLVDSVSPAAELPTLESLAPPEIDLSDLDSLEETQNLLIEVGLLTA